MNDGDTRALPDSMRSAWLEQLSLEHEDICYQYRIDLRTPILELTDSRTRLGSWDGEHRVLAISIHLILDYPWAVVLQVLKHEIAHQICAELLHRPDEGHGAMFRIACERIGLSGPFCRAAADCAEGITVEMEQGSPRIDRGRAVLAKVEKLLALAGSDNEHEASLAMQRAGELLARHNLSLSDREGEYRHLVLRTGKQRLAGHLRSIGSLLQEYFFVRVIFSSEYDPARDVRQRTIELLGRPENVAVAEHCYHFLLSELERLWNRNRHRFKGAGGKARNSYLQGVIAGFRQKLAAGEQSGPVRDRTQTGTTSMVTIRADQGLEQFTARLFPRLVTRRAKAVTVHGRAWNDAVAEGKKLVLHRAMEESAGGFGGLLGG